MKISQLRQIIKEEISKTLNEQESWDEFDKRMADRDAQEDAKAAAFIETPRGRNAVMTIKKLISKPYTSRQLDEVLDILNLDKTQFMYAAKAAGMDLSTDGSSIRIFDKNYKNKDVSIAYMKGNWYVG